MGKKRNKNEIQVSSCQQHFHKQIEMTNGQSFFHFFFLLHRSPMLNHADIYFQVVITGVPFGLDMMNMNRVGEEKKRSVPIFKSNLLSYKCASA